MKSADNLFDKYRPSWSRICRTSARRSGDRAGGLPPIRPRLRAADSPSLVLSEIRSLSNWAMEANTWKTRRPAGVVVSMSSAKDRKPAPFSRITSTMVNKSCKERLRRSYFEPTTDRHHVAWAKVLQQGLQFWTLRLGTGNLFGPGTLGSSIFQCSDLSIEMLILCRYPRISQDHSKNLQQPL